MPTQPRQLKGKKALVPGAIITCIYYAVKMCSITETAATMEREVEE